jgi:ABC-2 type transport system ATP-binding protein
MITVEHLTKYYGDHLAVDDLSFEISDGHVYGFLGPNGAGKSTTMNIMTGCLSATEGHVRIDGHDIFEEPREAKRLIGYLPEQPPLYMSESPLDYLRFVGKAKGLRGAELNEQIEQVIAQTGIEKVRYRRIATLSKGYKQRVGIAQALLGNPKVIILDEPTVGLDPLQIIEIRDLIKSLGETHTVIFSSHILSEVQTICDQILMLAKGKLVAFDTPTNLEEQLLSSKEMTITTDAPEAEVRSLLASLPEISDFTVSEEAPYLRVKMKTELPDIYEVSRAVFHVFASNGLTLLEMNITKGSLEDIFVELAQSPEPSEWEDDNAEQNPEDDSDEENRIDEESEEKEDDEPCLP